MAWHGMVCRGVAWLGMAWRGMAWHGMAWSAVAWHDVAWRGVAWRGMARAVRKVTIETATGRDRPNLTYAVMACIVVAYTVTGLCGYGPV